MSRAATILEFWFGRLDAAGLPDARAERRWFNADDAFDAEVRARFEPDLRNASAGRLSRWERDPRSALALVILFDQFPRNMYRGKPRAFLFDVHARAVAERTVARGLDVRLQPVERAFLYMPFEHSEDAADQARSVRLFRQLVDAAPESQRERFRGYLSYALQHQEVIARFGRFPHRNRVLGRTSTAAEAAYLREGGSTWGQLRDAE